MKKFTPKPCSLGTAFLQASLILVLFLTSLSTLEAQRFPFARDWPNTDFENSVIDLSEVRSGGVPKDGIPAIDAPEFTSVADAFDWLNPREPVIVVDILGHAKAYPLQILIWHEIVNDTLNERRVAVTFCPLCNASIVFDRNIEG